MLKKVAISLLIFSNITFAESKANLKVGVIAPLSGPVASMGEAFRRGFELYKSENVSCSNKSKILFEDGKYDGKSTLSSFHRLNTNEKVDLTIVWGNTPSSVLAPLAESRKLPLLALSYTPEAKGRSHVISFGPKTKLLVQKISEEFKKWNLKKPAAVAVNLGNILEEIEYVKDSLGGNLAIQVVPTEEQDFHSILARLKANNVDGLLAFLLPAQAITFAKQAVELKYTPPMMGADIFADTSFGNKIAKFIPQLAYVYSSVKPSFVEHLKSLFKDETYFFEVACGYTLSQLICSLAQTKEKNENFNIIKEIKTTKLHSSPIEGINFKSDEEYGDHFENDAKIYYISETKQK